MVKVEEHGSTPADPKSPVYRHASETARSQNDAGGKVPVSQYEGQDKALTPKREFFAMTVRADLIAINPTATAVKAFAAKGTNVAMLLASLEQDVSEMQSKLKQVIADHPNDSVLSATVNAAGSGGTNGPCTITGTTGTGTKFQAKGIISGGALTSITSITNAGSYSTDPTNLSSEPVTGGPTGAAVSLVMSGDLAVLTALSNILAELA